MKYPQLVSSTTPASLRDWLEEELESRGIDGVYTRYILSLLQQDSLDLDLPECDHLTKLQQKCPLQVGNKEQTPLHLAKSRHKRWKSWERESLHKPDSCSYCSCGLSLNFEERRKTAAVECLKSASEQKFGIEKLIDELCTKLKNIGSREDGIQNGTSAGNFENATIELESIPHASPQEQAEKYYAAFPALSGKTEPLTKLCHQQERGPVFRSVWDGRHVIRRGQENSHLNAVGNEGYAVFLEDRWQKYEASSDCESNASEKENEISSKENGGGRMGIKHHRSSEKCKDVPFGHSSSRKPSFIIPKMKTATQRVPFTVKRSPFNPSVAKHTSKTKRWVDTKKVKESIHGKKDNSPLGTEENASMRSDHLISCSDPLTSHCEDIISKLLEETVVELCEVDGPVACRCPFRNVLGGCSKEFELVLSSSITGMQPHCTEDTVTQLINKFDNSLAAIWGSGNVIGTGNSTYWTETTGSLSFTVFPLKSPSMEAFPKSTGSMSPTSIYSVWSIGGEDLEIFKVSDPNDLPVTDCPPKSHSLAAGIVSGVLNGLQLSKSTDFNKAVSPISDTFSPFNGLETPGKDPLLAFDLEEDLDRILSVCPDSYFASLSAGSEPSLPERTTPGTSLEESFISHNKGIYTLWECSSPDLHLTLGIKAKPPWHSFHIRDQNNSGWKLSGNSPTNDRHGGLGEQLTSDDGPSVSDSFSTGNTSHMWNHSGTKHSPCRRNCTLLYHKGESRFVEVVPSSKNRYLDSETISSVHCDDQEMNKVPSSGEELEVEENLLTSSKTHFQPIRQDSTETESIDSEVASTMEFAKERKYGPLRDKSGVDALYPPTLPLQLHRTLAESHVDKDVHETSLSHCSSDSSSRSFKVLKARSRALSSSYDELISLIGHHGAEDTTSSRSSCCSSPEDPEIPFHAWKLGMYRDKSTNTESQTPCSLAKVHTNVACINYQKFQHSVIEQMLGTFSEDEVEDWDSELVVSDRTKMSSWKTEWSLADDDDQYSWMPCNKPNSSTHTDESQETKGCENGSFVGSCEHQNLKALRKEIEEEEEQLFRDINCLADDSGSVVETDVDNFSVEQKDGILVHRKNALELTNLSHARASLRIYDKLYARSLPHSWKECSALPSKPFSPGLCKDDFVLEPEDSNRSGTLAFPSLPSEKVFFSSDLEDDWRKNSKPFDVQVPRKNILKFRAPQKRPCSFYLEGNCRRSDCKFSHDLATITCRFWEEGSCFKGITCPFLHGYPNDLECFFEDSPTSDCSFILESEADFPSLSTTSVAESETNAVPKERKDGKSSRLKKKRGRPHLPHAPTSQPSTIIS